MTRVRRLVVVSALVATAVACGRTHGPARPPNVLFVTLDTTRRDHCSVYGYERKTTPNLEAFAAEAAVFENAPPARRRRRAMPRERLRALGYVE